MDPRDSEPIPQPPEWPILGNLFQVHHPEPFEGIHALAARYGEIYRIRILAQKIIVISSYAMLNELCDESRFEKAIHYGLRELRDAIHDGLFTAYDTEPNWGIAHRTLVPAFGPLNVDGMFDSMKDIASQLVLKWLRHGSKYDIAATQDFTRLTLDTIALCSMDYRFNSFYTEDTHPFVQAMVKVLVYPDTRGWLPNVLRRTVFSLHERTYAQNISILRQMCRNLVSERVKVPRPDTNDLLNAMLNGKDPKTGKGLDPECVIDNLMTFLVAGHETTSGMLSFTIYYLLRNKDAYQKVKEEVDSVVGLDDVQLKHLRKLPYIDAVLRESSRLYPTAPAIGFTPKSAQGAVVGGKYHVDRGETILASLALCHRDRAAYGDDAEEFRPERMLDENLANLPPNAWKSFGNGKRGCIGKGFAWQEMQLVMVMLFQHFDFELVDPEYKLRLDFTLTIKPRDLRIRAIPRPAVNLSGSALGSLLRSSKTEAKGNTPELTPMTEGKPITILYGSNSGTCETLARTLASDATEHGFKVSAIKVLDSATRQLPLDEPVIIVTASYEGRPTDDATSFYEWLENLTETERLTSEYAIFGCGHADWKQTFHRIPKTMDRMLQQYGGQRICELGLADASKGDMMGEFHTWEDTTLWPALRKRYGIESSGPQPTQRQGVVVDVSSKRGTDLRSDASEAKVLAVKTLTGPNEPVKKHIVIELPTGSTYRAGDYCAVLPFNPRETVHRVMTRFSLPFDTVLTVTSHMGMTLPNEPLSALDLFGAYLELSQPATRRNVLMLIEATDDELIKGALLELMTDNFNAAITEKRVSLLDLLERYPSVQLPLGSFVASLIPMRVRQYSIASSPLAGAQRVTLVYDVLDGPSTAGGSRHIGVASNYLSSLRPGDIIHASIKASHQPFHIPEDDNTPVVMIAAGAGLAPFRGFIEERAAYLAAGRTLAPAHLFFGCRGPTRDDLYRDELDAWQAAGAVVTHRSYSRAPEHSGGMKHINEVILAERKLLIALWERNAKVYVCGSRAVGESVKQAFLNIAGEMARDRGEDDAEDCMQRWFEGIRNQRYTTDVFT
ncbi:hypothetical protein AMS68_000110 [Peltaster fructicola]|uniref:Bifunctional cytochrome P450/NADPH--P450 reductase n=1 Tax=Peltaster fructicola TaxID=286661 RepID=A0A6H0XIP0_9PEZI|nr:hypothetical protein AMS68_000110 [Peltaster fructicola]